MKKALSRGRWVLMTLACLTALSSTGCYGLTDLQLSTILQSTVATGLQSLITALISGATGVTL